MSKPNSNSTKERIDTKGHQAAGILVRIIDVFYPPFKKIFPIHTFRYAACGGGNQLLNLIIYFISYNYIFKKSNWHLGFVVFKPHIAALVVAFLVTFPIGFLLSRYVVFSTSEMKGRKQAAFYVMITGICILLNYSLMKLFVEVFHWYPTPSMLLNIVVVVTFSYISQKNIAFK